MMIWCVVVNKVRSVHCKGEKINYSMMCDCRSSEIKCKIRIAVLVDYIAVIHNGLLMSDVSAGRK